MTDLTALHRPAFDIEQLGTATAIAAFALLFAGAQAMHPDPFALSMPQDGAAFAAHINGATLLHWAHLLEFACAPLLIVMAVHFHGRLKPLRPGLALVALLMAGIGAFMLAGNKAALCLTASAFDTLDDSALMALVPGLEALMHRAGLMVVLWGIPLLPLGFALFAWAMMRDGLAPARQMVPLLLGCLMLANPDLQAVNTIAATLMAIGLLPYSLGLAKTAWA